VLVGERWGRILSLMGEGFFVLPEAHQSLTAVSQQPPWDTVLINLKTKKEQRHQGNLLYLKQSESGTDDDLPFPLLWGGKPCQ
jgi:hypothetical protein